MMKRRGVTLIETIAVIAILSILFMISFKSAVYYKSHIEKIENTSVIYNVKEFLIFSKKFCYEKQQSGEIYFDDCASFTKVYLVSKGQIIKELDIIGEFKILNSNYVSNNKKIILLKVNQDGYINPFTIRIMDNNNLIKEIVIQVGGNLVYIRNG